MEEKPEPLPEAIDIPKVCVDNKSQFSAEYDEYFRDVQPDKYSTEDLKRKLHAMDILTYNKYSETQLFIVSVKRQGANKQIMKIKVKYGPFILKISALIVLEQSKFHSIDSIYSANTTVYPLSKKTIIKCFSYKPQELQSSVISVLRQVCFLKICQAIQVGPTLNQECQFDLVVYNKCIEVFMERCITLEQTKKDLLNERQLGILKVKLKRLHSLGIVHIDIKLANICYSPSLNELVFIDFGYSRFITEDIGFKSYTNFLGTQRYFCKEMQIIRKQGYGLVDLYYNDVACLSITLKQIKSSLSSNIIKNMVQNDQEEYYGQDTQKIKLESSIKFFNRKYVPKLRNIDNIFSQKRNNQYDNFKNIHFFQKKAKLLQQIFKEQPNNTQNYQEQDFQHFFKKNSSNQIHKQQKVQNLIKKKQAVQNMFDFNFLDEQISFSKDDLLSFKINITKAKQLKTFLLSKESANTLSKDLYFQHLVSFLNFKVPISTYQQKIEAARILLLHNSIQINPSIHILKQANYFLLNHFINNNTDSFVRQIPIIYGNLIILNTHLPQLSTIVTNILEKSMSITQLFEIFVRLLLNTYWSILHYYNTKQIFTFFQLIQEPLLKKLAFITQESSEMQKNIVHDFTNLRNYIRVFELQKQKYNSCPKVYSYLWIERSLIYELAIFQLFLEILFFQSASVQMFKCYTQYIISLLCLAKETSDNVIDYYHYHYIAYCQGNFYHGQIANMRIKLQRCIGEKSLAKQNTIFWADNPFQWNNFSLEPQEIIKYKINFLNELLENIKKFKNKQLNHYVNIFTRIKALKKDQQFQVQQKIKEIQIEYKQHFRILNQQGLQDFLQSSQYSQVFYYDKDNRNKNMSSYQKLMSRPQYFYIMNNLYKNDQNFSRESFINSYNKILLQTNKNQRDETKRKFVQMEVLYHEIFNYQNKKITIYILDKITKYLSSPLLNHIANDRKKSFINYTISRLWHQEQTQQFTQAIDRFLLAIVQAFKGSNCLDTQYIRQHSIHTYTYIFCRLADQKHFTQYVWFIMMLFNIVKGIPNKENMQSIIKIMKLLFGYPSSSKKQVFMIALLPIMHEYIMEDNPHLLMLYIFLIFKKIRETKQQIGFLFRMLNRHIGKLHQIGRSIIMQIILYKIVNKDSQFIMSLHRNKSERQLSRIKAWARKKYLKQSLHEVKINIKRYNYGFSNTKAHCKFLFEKYLVNYNQSFFDKNDLRSKIEFPNPF